MGVSARLRFNTADLAHIFNPGAVNKVLNAIRGAGGLFAAGYLTYNLGKNIGKWLYSKFDSWNIMDNYKQLIQLDPGLEKHASKVLQALQYIARTNSEMLLDLPALHRAVLAFIRVPYGMEFVGMVANYRGHSNMPIEVALT